MCGIVGYTGKQSVVPVLLEGLHQLEYRGYDSSGIALQRGDRLAVHRRCGKIRVLESDLPKRLAGKTGIGHTRWATHGEPTDDNAHPHSSEDGRFAVVHNGIIENSDPLRARLVEHGVHFASETDSEVLAHLVAAADAPTLLERVRLALAEVEGTYGIAVIDAESPGEIVVARNGSPVVIGIGDKEMLVASDVGALVRHTQQVVYLDDGEIAELTPSAYRVITLDAAPATKQSASIDWSEETYARGEYSHYTLKEIHEQPESIRRTLRGRLDRRFQAAHLGGLNLDARELLNFRRIKVLGCGSAYISGCIGARIVEQLSRVPCDAEPAAEFRYRNPVIEADTLYLAVSQSGETFDTLSAVQEIKRKGGRVLGVVNAVGSSIARACDGGVYLHAGPEIAVVSTKTFTSTIAALALLALHVGRMRDVSVAQGKRLLDALDALPDAIQTILDAEDEYRQMAKKYAHYDNAYFIGRNLGFGVAMEGALKLKEVSYLHAEAYPASELKHGPLALVSPEVPTVFVLPDDDLLDKNLSSIEQVRSRKGPVLAVTHPLGENAERLAALADDVLEVPKLHEYLDPILMLIPLQFLAYFIALERGCDVDQPRNLAKSVTVE
ncbi:MAG: glutamine--fructose-6-phosphate transaminase (isomerizing) [Gammaproteobacteria bacterium]|nr:glutamine--fructose-6-phosphate transaminase (isomerizing) [Gammaproteobacteria bacterium]